MLYPIILGRSEVTMTPFRDKIIRPELCYILFYSFFVYLRAISVRRLKKSPRTMSGLYRGPRSVPKNELKARLDK